MDIEEKHQIYFTKEKSSVITWPNPKVGSTHCPPEFKASLNNAFDSWSTWGKIHLINCIFRKYGCVESKAWNQLAVIGSDFLNLTFNL